jgi:mevalonate kinase
MTIASAPAKIILFGEHFVIYDQPAILASINKRIKIDSRITQKNNNKIRIETNDFGKKIYPLSMLKNMDCNRNNDFFYPIIYILKKILQDPEKINGIDIKIKSEIPYGVGLGSSAALSVAAVASIYGLYNRYSKKNQILELAIETEKLIHRNSSGADCVIATYGGLMYYQKKINFRPLKYSKKLNFIIINTGLKHSTAELVSIVERFRQNNFTTFLTLSNKVTNICDNAIEALKEGNIIKLGKLMNENQILLEQIGVSNKEINKIIDSSLDYGAIGSKLTGAGGGGCILSLINQEKKEYFLNNMRKNGYECFAITIENQGVKVKI